MYKEDFIEFLNKHELPYDEETIGGEELIYVYSKDIYELKQKNPEKYDYIFLPHLRVSHMDQAEWYVRDCGICEFVPCSIIMERCLEL